MGNKRRDGERIMGLDGFHSINTYVMPKRTEAEVSITENFDVTALNEFLKKYNEEHGTNIKLFHAICTAMARTIYHRPKMNIFIAGRRYYQRNEITFSFVVKRTFDDHSEESLMFMKAEPDMNLESISKMILGDVNKVRNEPIENNDIDKLMATVGKLPRPLLTALFKAVEIMEYHGVVPAGLTNGDPNYSTMLLSNLGSIGSSSCYHHLSNYGTCSLMGTIGKMQDELKLKADGSVENRTVVDMTFTIDERIADGFYFAKSLRIVKYLFEHPECLLEQISEPVPVDL